MKKFLTIASTVTLCGALTACGSTTSGLLDGLFATDDGGVTDMVQTGDLSWYHLPSGVWQVTDDVTNLVDGCNQTPNDPNNPTKGQIWALENMGGGLIKLGNPTDYANPGNPQQYDAAESGVPAQPAQGESCPAQGAPAQCSTEPTAVPFGVSPMNEGWLVRDNDNSVQTMGNCFYHRHIVNKVVLTSDTTFTAQYVRSDTKHNTCTQMTDCTESWTWNFKFVKAFGQ